MDSSCQSLDNFVLVLTILVNGHKASHYHSDYLEENTDVNDRDSEFIL